MPPTRVRARKPHAPAATGREELRDTERHRDSQGFMSLPRSTEASPDATASHTGAAQVVHRSEPLLTGTRWRVQTTCSPPGSLCGFDQDGLRKPGNDSRASATSRRPLRRRRSRRRGDRDGILLLPRQRRDPEQWWYWTAEWQAAERELEADLAAGSHGPVFSSGTEFLATLRKIARSKPSSNSTPR